MRVIDPKTRPHKHQILPAPKKCSISDCRCSISNYSIVYTPMNIITYTFLNPTSRRVSSRACAVISCVLNQISSIFFGSRNSKIWEGRSKLSFGTKQTGHGKFVLPPRVNVIAALLTKKINVKSSTIDRNIKLTVLLDLQIS